MNDTLTKVIEIDASPEIVFRAISDPAELTNWFPDVAVLEPKVGGKMKFSFLKESHRKPMEIPNDFFNEGKIIEFVKNKKLVYTWKWKDVPDFVETVVSWDLEQIGANKTKLTLTHSGFTGKEPDMLGVKGHNEGWTFYLGHLVSYCTNNLKTRG